MTMPEPAQVLDLLLENFEWRKMTPDVRDTLVTEGAIYFCPGDSAATVACHVESVYHANPDADYDRLREMTTSGDTAAGGSAQSQAWCVVVEEPSDNRETYECADVVGPFDTRDEAVAAADKLRAELAAKGYTLTATPTQLRTVAEVLQ